MQAWGPLFFTMLFGDDALKGVCRKPARKPGCVNDWKPSAKDRSTPTQSLAHIKLVWFWNIGATKCSYSTPVFRLWMVQGLLSKTLPPVISGIWCPDSINGPHCSSRQPCTTEFKWNHFDWACSKSAIWFWEMWNCRQLSKRCSQDHFVLLQFLWKWNVCAKNGRFCCRIEARIMFAVTCMHARGKWLDRILFSCLAHHQSRMYRLHRDASFSARKSLERISCQMKRTQRTKNVACFHFCSKFLNYVVSCFLAVLGEKVLLVSNVCGVAASP